MDVHFFESLPQYTTLGKDSNDHAAEINFDTDPDFLCITTFFDELNDLDTTRNLILLRASSLQIRRCEGYKFPLEPAKQGSSFHSYLLLFL
jgi:hypothetical protein